MADMETRCKNAGNFRYIIYIVIVKSLGKNLCIALQPAQPCTATSSTENERNMMVAVSKV